jgi:hypothetical protein
MRRIYLALVAGLANLLACTSDARKILVTELVAFAQAAPYDVRVERNESSEYLVIVVQDTALPRYTSLVERLATDSAAAPRAYYSGLAPFLFVHTSVLEAAAQPRGGGRSLTSGIAARRHDSSAA